MASLQNRNGSWRVIFRYKGEWHAFTLAEVSAADPAVHKASTEELPRLLKRNVLDLPSGCIIEHFLFHRGKPPEHAEAAANGKKERTLAELRDTYVKSQEKKLEPTTLDGIRLHFDHLTRIVGEKRLIPV